MKNIIILIIGLVIGSAFTFLASKTPPPLTDDQALNAQLSTKLFESTKKISELSQQVDQLKEALASAGVGLSKVEGVLAIQQTPLPENSLQDSDQVAYQDLYTVAMEALEKEDIQEAQKHLNRLLNNAKSEEDKERAKEGLIETFNQLVNHFKHTPGQTHSQLWMLFEMHKLSPTSGVRDEIVSLSQHALEEAERLKDENEILGSADHYSSLMHLSKMLDFEVPSSSGQILNTDNFSSQLNSIQEQQEYIPALKSRAQIRLYSGTDIEKAHVFWDYANLATIDKSLDLRQGEFREEFIQASITHLDFLKEMNQVSEVKSRMDYIRWAFPAVMNDARMLAVQ